MHYTQRHFQRPAFARSGGSTNPTPSGTIHFDTRAGGAEDLQATSTRAQALALFPGETSGWSYTTNYDGNGTRAMAVNWENYGGACADQEERLEINFGSPKPTEVYMQWKEWLSKTATGDGIGSADSFQITNAACGAGGNAGKKCWMILRDGVGGGSEGRLEMLWAGPAPVDVKFTSDSYSLSQSQNQGVNFAPQTNLSTVLITTIHIKSASTRSAADGVWEMWVNGAKRISATNVSLSSYAFDRWQLPTVFNSPTTDCTQYYYDFVAWEP